VYLLEPDATPPARGLPEGPRSPGLLPTKSPWLAARCTGGGADAAAAFQRHSGVRVCFCVYVRLFAFVCVHVFSQCLVG
jgi:hypothetical protein